MTQGVIPFLAYENGTAAMDWLAQAFGFTEQTRWLNDDGQLAHGEMATEFGTIMMASGITAFESNNTHKQHCPQTAQWLSTLYVVNGVLVIVSDVEQHYKQAKNAGAFILSEPEDGPPGRRYRCEDLEGHRWMFMEREASQ